MSKRIFLLVTATLLWLSGSVWAQDVASGFGTGTGSGAVWVSHDSFLGVFTEVVTNENLARYKLRERRGVAITKVVKDSPAEKAGLKQDDVILSFDGEPVTSVTKLNRLIREAAPEKTVQLTISRDGAEQNISVTLGTRKDSVYSYGFGGDSEVARRYAEEARERAQEFRERTRELREQERDRGRTYAFRFGNWSHRRIGVSTMEISEQLAEYFGVPGKRGVLVKSVTENSPAAKAGIKAGDVITEVDSDKVEAVGDLTRAINRKEDGEIKLTLIRNKNPMTLTLTPERYQAPAPPSTFYFSAPEIDIDIVPPVVMIDPPAGLIDPPDVGPLRPLAAPRLRVQPRVVRPLRSVRPIYF